VESQQLPAQGEALQNQAFMETESAKQPAAARSWQESYRIAESSLWSSH
jgi:hypothetical protein